jgi:tRNA threonylcarbamoyladenosine biosynthesis protein TsaE
VILRCRLPDEQATAQSAHDWALRIRDQAPGGGAIIHLQGELGAGKTAWARAFIQALGWMGAVKSPSYGLLEIYELPPIRVHHLDLYRLSDPQELEYLGIRDLAAVPAIWLVEWPEQGAGALPAADLRLSLAYDPADVQGRLLTIEALTERAADWLGACAQI